MKIHYTAWYATTSGDPKFHLRRGTLNQKELDDLVEKEQAIDEIHGEQVELDSVNYDSFEL